MGRVVGIIAEYNPFHTGHLYHITQAKARACAEIAVCVISGNFVQRGESSLINKWTKTEMALVNGADLVIELPVLYSVSSAENFASGAIKILDELGVVDDIAFGTESPDIQILNDIANVVLKEPREYQAILKHQLSVGNSFPVARENAILMYLNDEQEYGSVLHGPNNILAIEYLKAMKKSKSKMIPMAIKREKVGYNATRRIGEFASGTAIRNYLIRKEYRDIQKTMPASSYGILREEMKNGNYVLDLSAYEKIIIYNLRKMSLAEIANLPDVNEGLENLIKKAANSSNNLIDLISNIKSKRYTQTRIQRILVYALLGITKQDMEMAQKTTPYIRVLGVNDKGRSLLSEMSMINKKANVVTSVKKFMDTNSNKALRQMMEKDMFATDVYTLGYKKESYSNLDYTQNLIIM